jgi:hypothetical protein
MFLAETEEVANLLYVSFHYDCTVVEISLLLLGLLCENVAVISVLTLDLACTSKLETLFSSGICFNFWHFFVCYLIINNVSGNAYTTALRTFFLAVNFVG